MDAALGTDRLGAERRRRDRVSDRFQAAVLPAGRGPHELKGEVRDFDSEGLCLEADRPLPLGRPVRLSFKLPPSMSQAFRGLPCKLPARVRTVRETGRAERPYDIVLEWRNPLMEAVTGSIAKHQREVGALIALIIGGVLYFKWQTLAYFWYTPFVYLYSLLIAAYFLSRFILSAVHKTPPLRGYTPSISIVISVRNEEGAIAETVASCFAADYPDELREVIVVNDGSTDGTAAVLERSAKIHPKLKVFTLPPSGKRHGMSTGVRNASGELIVFLDSDTLIYPTALRHIVCGFEDPSLGAVSGHTEVTNAGLNALTGLQDVRYYLSFKWLKSSESVFGLVTCCPGCLSAYRKEYVLKILDPWLNQMFLGAPATFGDDRSLTNYILRDYRVIYNDKAICLTLVPETWKRYMTQQVRWKKSWLRETLRASCFMWKKHPVGAISFYITSICSILSPLMCVKLLFLTMTAQSEGLYYYLSGLTLIGLLQCLFVLRQRPHSRWLLGMVMVASQIVLMGPQTYYAIFTMRKNHWGTR